MEASIAYYTQYRENKEVKALYYRDTFTIPRGMTPSVSFTGTSEGIIGGLTIVRRR
jgi:hypothetical protein